MTKDNSFVAIIAYLLIIVLTIGLTVIFNIHKNIFSPVLTWEEMGTHKYKTSHQQEIWISVLEWCESRGVLMAVNPNDKDNTPSYYSYQWKPETFKSYAIKYGLLYKDLNYEDYFNHMSDYPLEREILRRMVGDPDVVWSREFPDCVRLYGRPPLR